MHQPISGDDHFALRFSCPSYLYNAAHSNVRFVTDIGHWGTGNVEVALSNLADLDAVNPFLVRTVARGLARSLSF